MALFNRWMAVALALFLGLAAAGCQTDRGMGDQPGGTGGGAGGGSGSPGQGGYLR